MADFNKFTKKDLPRDTVVFLDVLTPVSAIAAGGALSLFMAGLIGPGVGLLLVSALTFGLCFAAINQDLGEWAAAQEKTPTDRAEQPSRPGHED